MLLHQSVQRGQLRATTLVVNRGAIGRTVAQYLMERSGEIRFDQLIWEGDWVHASFVAGKPRSEALTAHFRGGGVDYTKGIA